MIIRYNCRPVNFPLRFFAFGDNMIASKKKEKTHGRPGNH